jgi:hypothetical protein
VGPLELYVTPQAHWFEWFVFGPDGYPVYVNGEPLQGLQVLGLDKAKAASEAALKTHLSAWLKEFDE